MSSQRREELAANLAAVRNRIERACLDAGRSPAEVSLLAVSKTFPAADIAGLAALGLPDMGESRHQEAVAKVELLGTPDGYAGVPAETCRTVRWHFLGQLQRNKAAAIAAYAHCVQSVDRIEIVPLLARGAALSGRSLEVLLQVNLDDDALPGRGGVSPGDVPRLAALVGDTPDLVLRGVMAVAPRGGDPRPAFARLRSVSAALRADHPTAGVVSAGMSGDLEAAIAEGATLVRVGTALFGHRSPALG